MKRDLELLQKILSFIEEHNEKSVEYRDYFNHIEKDIPVNEDNIDTAIKKINGEIFPPYEGEDLRELKEELYKDAKLEALKHHLNLLEEQGLIISERTSKSISLVVNRNTLIFDPLELTNLGHDFVELWKIEESKGKIRRIVDKIGLESMLKEGSRRGMYYVLFELAPKLLG